MSDPKVLHLTLHRKWFDLIAIGKKKIEYRDATPYWDKRLKDREYDEIHFRNGYNPNNPFMRVKMVEIDTDPENLQWFIYLGEILEIKNWDGPKEEKS